MKLRFNPVVMLGAVAVALGMGQQQRVSLLRRTTRVYGGSCLAPALPLAAPRRWGRTQPGWRRVESRRRHAERMYRQRRNARRGR